MGADSGFFLSPFLIRELVKWRQSTGENIAVFEPVHRSCTAAGTAVADGDNAKLIGNKLHTWCASREFEALMLSCAKTRRNLWLDEAVQHLRSLMEPNDEQAQQLKKIGGTSLEQILCAFSALLRTELRIWDSRSSARIDELFVWQREFEKISATDFALWLLCNLIEGTGAHVYDKLTTLRQSGAEFKVSRTSDPDMALRPALLAGIGHASFYDYDQAAAVFSKVRDLPDVDGCYGLLGLALVAYMRGDEAGAQRLILTDSSNAPGIMHAVRILVFGASVISPVIEDRQSNREVATGTEHVCDELCAQALAFVSIQSGDYARAEELLASAIKRESYQAGAVGLYTLLLLAESILTPIREAYFEDPPLPGAPEHEYTSRIALAKDHLERALQLSQSEGLARGTNRVRLNLSCALILNRKFDAALKTLEPLLASEPENIQAIFNKSAALLLLGMLPQLYQCVEPLRNREALVAGRMVADACYHTGDFSESLRLWGQILEYEKDRLWLMRSLIRQLEIFRMLRNQSEAQQCTDALMKHFRFEAEALFALGCELAQIGEKERAIELLDGARELAGPNLKRWIAWELARIYCDQDKTLSATNEYTLTADKDTDSPQAREFIVALYRAGLLPAAHERAVALRRAGGAILPGITEIEVDFLMQNEEHEKARDLLLELARVRPLSVTNRIALIQLYLHLREFTNARHALDEIDVSRLPEEVIQQLLSLEEQLETMSPQSRAGSF